MDLLPQLIAKTSAQYWAASSRNFGIRVDQNGFLPTHAASIRVYAVEKTTATKLEQSKTSWFRVRNSSNILLENNSENFHFSLNDIGSRIVCLVEVGKFSEIAVFGPIVMNAETHFEVNELLNKKSEGFGAQIITYLKPGQTIATEEYDTTLPPNLEIKIFSQDVSLTFDQQEKSLPQSEISFEESNLNPLVTIMKTNSPSLSFIGETFGSKNFESLVLAIKFSSRLKRDAFMILLKLSSKVNQAPLEVILANLEAEHDPRTNSQNPMDLLLFINNLKELMKHDEEGIKHFTNSKFELQAHVNRLENDLQCLVSEMKDKWTSIRAVKNEEDKAREEEEEKIRKEIEEERKRSETLNQELESIKDRLKSKKEQSKKLLENLEEVKALNSSFARSSLNNSVIQIDQSFEIQRQVPEKIQNNNVREELTNARQEYDRMVSELNEVRKENKMLNDNFVRVHVENKMLKEELESSMNIKEQRELRIVVESLENETNKLALSGKTLEEELEQLEKEEAWLFNANQEFQKLLD